MDYSKMLLNYIDHHKNFLRQIPNYFGIATLDGRYAFSNEKTAHLLGFNCADQLIGVDFFNVKCALAQDSEPLIPGLSD